MVKPSADAVMFGDASEIEITFKINLSSVITNLNLDLISPDKYPNDADILKAANIKNDNSLIIGELRVQFTNVPGVVNIVAKEGSKIYGGAPVKVNYKIALSSIIKKNDTLGLIVNDKNEPIKSDVPTIKRMLSEKYKDDLDVNSIDVVISTKNGFAIITPKDKTNYVKSANISFKVAIELYIPDNSIKDSIKGFKTDDELKAIFQAQLDAEKISVDLSQTEIIKNENGELTFRVLKDSKLYDSTNKYNKFKISYKYVASSLIKDKKLGIFDRFPDKSEIKERLSDKGIDSKEIDSDSIIIKPDGTAIFTTSKNSKLYVPGEKIIAQFQVKLTDKVNNLGTLSPIDDFGDHAKIFDRIMIANPET
jgi:hypothetical protein